MSASLEDLKMNAAKIAKNAEERERLTQYRDRIIHELRANGVTWRELQEVSGLSPRGLKIVLDREK